VELAKIRCSENQATTAVELQAVEAGLMEELTTTDMHQHLDALLQRTVACALECVHRAGLRSEGALDAIYLTGGSSALKPFQQTLQAAFPGVPLVQGDLFGGVASGLAYSGR
jgi:hypothetical chaperone protein